MLGGSTAIDEDLRRRGMKRYVPSAAMAENCDLENHRSKLKICQSDEKTTEDESEDEPVKTDKIKRHDDKEGKRGERSKDVKKEVGKIEQQTEDHKMKDSLREDGKSRISDREKVKDADQHMDCKSSKEHKKLEEKTDKTKRPDNVNKDSKKVEEKFDRSKKSEEGNRELKSTVEKFAKHDRSDRGSESKKDVKQKSKEQESKYKCERPSEVIKSDQSREVVKKEDSNGVRQEDEPSSDGNQDNKEPTLKHEATEKRRISSDNEILTDRNDKKEHKGRRDDEKSSNRSKEYRKEKLKDSDPRSDHTNRVEHRSSKTNDHKNSKKLFNEERTKSEHKRKVVNEEHSTGTEAKKKKPDHQTEERSMKLKSVNQSPIGNTKLL